MLVWVQYPVLLEVGEHAADDDVFLQLADDRCQGYWSVIAWVMLGTFLVYRGYQGVSPGLRNGSCIVELLEEDTDWARKLGGQVTQYTGREGVWAGGFVRLQVAK